MEVRTPFLNLPILEFAANLDLSYKVPSIQHKLTNKYILKKVLERYLPREMVYYKKMGFGYNVTYESLLVNDRTIPEIVYYFNKILPQIDCFDTKKSQYIRNDYHI
jgi:asparagine synthase (glutamine-hydrolysing)